MPTIEVNDDVELSDVDLDDLLDAAAENLQFVKRLHSHEELSLKELIRIINENKHINLKVKEPLAADNLKDHFKIEFLEHLSNKYTEEQLREMEQKFINQ